MSDRQSGAAALGEEMQESIVVFGNCQAGAVAECFRYVPELTAAAHLYVPSFNISEEEVERLLSPEVRQNCTLLLEQVTPSVNLSSRYDFPNARRVSFPSLDMNLLWPLRADEKRMVPEPPAYPFGRYTYGDRVINEILSKGLAGDEAWTFFVHRSGALLPDLARLAAVEERRWLSAEAELDVRMSDAVFPHLATTRLFWTYNHPNRRLLCRFGGRILRAAGLAPEDDDAATELMLGILSWEFGSEYHQPIHPDVARSLSLSWWSPDIIYRRFDREMDYETFVRSQIAWA